MSRCCHPTPHQDRTVSGSRLIKIDLRRVITALKLRKHEAFLRSSVELPHTKRNKQSCNTQRCHKQTDSHHFSSVFSYRSARLHDVSEYLQAAVTHCPRCDLAITGYLPLNAHRQLSYIFTCAGGSGGPDGRRVVQPREAGRALFNAWFWRQVNLPVRVHG